MRIKKEKKRENPVLRGAPFGSVPKKKILLFNSSALLYGSEKGLLNIIKALKESCEITMVVPEDGPLIKIAESLGAKAKLFPLPVLSFSYSPLYYIRFIALSALNILYFSFYLLRNDIDILYTNNTLIIFPCLLAFLFKKTHIWHIREFYRIKALNRAIAFLAEKFSTGVICQSKNIRKSLFPGPAPKVSVIYEGLEPGSLDFSGKERIRRSLHIPPDSVIISIISRIHPLKGQYEFIKDISAILKNGRSNAVLLLAGDISPRNIRTYLYKRKIEGFIRENSLESRVRLLGLCEDTYALYAATDIAVFPYRRNEPFGISLLEALAFSCRISAAPNPGADEILLFFSNGYNILDITVLSDIIKEGVVNKKARSLPEDFLFRTYKDRMLLFIKGVC